MTFELHTKRLLLRPMRLEDAEGMYELNLAEDVYPNTGDRPFRNIQEAKELILNYNQFEKYKMGRFTIIDKKSNEYAGWCGLKYLEPTNEVDLGYRIMPVFRAKGIAYESAAKCLEYGFDNLSLSKIIGRATKENHASIAILKKTGMTFENEFIDHDTTCVQYGITRQEWTNNKHQINTDNNHNQIS